MNIESLNIRSLPVIALGEDPTGPFISSANGNAPHQRGGLDVSVVFGDIPSTVRVATIQEVLSHELLVETAHGEWRYHAKHGLRDGKGGMFYDYFDFTGGKWDMNSGQSVETPTFRDAPYKGLQPWWVRHEFDIQFRLWFCVVTNHGGIEEVIGSFKWGLGWALENKGSWGVLRSHGSQEESIRASLISGGDIEAVRGVIAAPDVKSETRKFYEPLEVAPAAPQPMTRPRK